MQELLEIVQGLREEIVGALRSDPSCHLVEQNFSRAIELICGEIHVKNNPEIQIALLNGKVEAYEKALSAFAPQKY